MTMSLTSGDSGPSAGTWDFSVCISPAQGAFQSLHSSIPVPSPPDLSNALPHSLAQTLPQPDTPAPPTPTFPPDTPMEGKNHPSSLSCSQPWDRTCWSFLFGMAKEITPGMEPLCHFRTLKAVLGSPSAHTACPPWPLSSWPWLFPLLQE